MIQTTTDGRIGNNALDLAKLQKIIDSLMGSSDDVNSTNDWKSYGKAADVISNLMPEKQEYAGKNGNLTRSLDTGYDQLSDVAALIPGVGPMASAVMKGGTLLSKGLDAIGAGTSGMTKTDALLGSTLGSFTPLGAVNGIFGKRSKQVNSNIQSNEALENVGSSYGGTVNDWVNAESKSRKKYGLFSSGARHRANRQINNANNQMSQMEDISDTSNLRSLLGSYMDDADMENYRMNLLGGYNKRTQMGKNGMKIHLDHIIDKASHINDSDIVEIEDTVDECDIPEGYNHEDYCDGYSNVLKDQEVPVFQAGGEMNLIPEGALHARKNNMDIDNITKKGIPVVDNEGKQQAEIERNEIIFKKDVSQKLEELAKDGSDEAALKAGKLLAKEIIENTDDRTGLIKEAKNGMKVQYGGKTLVQTQKGNNEGVLKLSDHEKDVLRELLIEKTL